jgi:hypothetical protein
MFVVFSPLSQRFLMSASASIVKMRLSVTIVNAVTSGWKNR